MSRSHQIPPDIGPNHFISIPQIAHVLGYSEGHLRRLLKARKLPLETIKLSPRKEGAKYGDVLALLERPRQAA